MLLLMHTKTSQTVLNNNHSTINDDSKIQSAETHQVAGYTGLHHAGDGHEHRHGYNSCGDECGTPVTQQQ